MKFRRARPKTTYRNYFCPSVEKLGARRLLSVNSGMDAAEVGQMETDADGVSLSQQLADLRFHTWAPSGSAANVSSSGDSLGGMDFQVGSSSGSMALLRGKFPEHLFPNGVDLSAGVDFDIHSNVQTVVVTFSDICGDTRHHWLRDIASDAGTPTSFSSSDLDGLLNIRHIDFAIQEKDVTGSLYVGQAGMVVEEPPVEEEEDPPAEETDPPNEESGQVLDVADLRFHVWAPAGSVATISSPDDAVSGMEFQLAGGSGAMALLRGKVSDPNGMDLSSGVDLVLRTDAPTIVVTFVDVLGETRHRRLNNVSSEFGPLTSFSASDLSGLGNIRHIDFAVVEQGVSGSLHVGQSGDVVEEPPVEEEEEPPVEETDPPAANASLVDLQFHVWAPSGSDATLFTTAESMAGMNFQVGSNAGSMALMRGKFTEQMYPDGVDLSSGIDLAIRTDVPTIVVTFKDVNGQVRNHWLNDISADVGSASHFSASDLSGLGNIRSIDFAVLERDTSGSIYLEPLDPCDLEAVDCIYAGDEIDFQQTLASAGPAKVFYVYPDAVIDGLDIVDRQGDEIHFMDGARVVGNVQTPGHWTTDRGVINITNSDDLLLTGLDVTNEFQYQGIVSTVDVQSSTALNISWSHNIEIEDATLTSNGKSTVWIQGNSTVEMTDVSVDCYYFCVGVAASDVHTKDLTVSQFNPVVTGDKHSAFWVSHTMRTNVGNVFYGNSNVIFEDTTIHKKTGEGMVVGNGGYDYASNVVFRGTTQVFATDYAQTATDAWLPIHRNYNGITVHLEGDYPATTLDLATNPNEFGRFLMHTYGADVAPPYVSPLVVCIDQQCVSSNDVLGL